MTLYVMTVGYTVQINYHCTTCTKELQEEKMLKIKKTPLPTELLSLAYAHLLVNPAQQIQKFRSMTINLQQLTAV